MARRPATTSAGNFWTPQSRQVFHERVARLNQHNREPCKPESYRQQDIGDNESYILKSGEELHLADHIAFLAQTEDGARNVSAVTIEEDQESRCFTLRVAANETPSDHTIKGLTEVLHVLEQYARKDMDRESCREQLFGKVIEMSTGRILSRIMEKQLSRSRLRVTTTVRAPLHSRIRSRLSALITSGTSERQETRELRDSIRVLAQCLENVNNSTRMNRGDLIKKAVRQSSTVSHLGNSQSFESHLKELGVAATTCDSREVLEVDKISRYFDLCNDLVHYCRRRSCRPIFSNIKVTKCMSPRSTRPIGAESICHTHGEVQLVLHYERYPQTPPPRSIGSSKSACLLCELFITAHGQYRVSHSHNRLYPQWTIPNTDWMTTAQVHRFQGIVQHMTNELARLQQTRKGQLVAVANGLESRVHLMYPPRLAGSVSTPTDFTPVPTPALTPPRTPSDECESQSTETLRDNNAAPKSPSSVSLSTQDLEDLPLRKEIGSGTAPFTLAIEGISLIFEFLVVREGVLDISRAKDKMVEGRTEAGLTSIDVVRDVLVEREVHVPCPEGSQTLRLRLSGAGIETLCLRFDWGVRSTDLEGSGGQAGLT